MADKLGLAELETGVDQSGLDAGLSTSRKKSAGFLADVSSSFKKNLGSSIGQGIGQGIGQLAARGVSQAIGTVVDGFKDMVGGAVAFEQGMRNVNSITRVTDAELEKMGDTALEIGGRFGQSAATMTDALYDISSSGFQGADALEVLEAAALAATAGMSTTGTAAAGLTAVLNAYGLKASEAGRVSDVMFETVNRGVITFDQLATEIGKTTALAAPLGVSIEEVGAAIAVMTRHGIEASDATTQINAVMTSLLKPSKEASDLARQLGLDWSAAGLKANGLSGTLNAMIKATGGSHEQMATLLGDARAIRGAFVLASDSGREFSEELDYMKDSAGAAGDAFGEQSKGTAFKIAQANAKLEAAGIAIGERLLPALGELASFVTTNVIPAIEAFGTVLDLLSGKLPETESEIEGLAGLLNALIPGGLGTAYTFDKLSERAAELGGKVHVAGIRVSAATAAMADKTKDDLRVTGSEFETLGDRATGAGRVIERSTDEILGSIRRLRDEVVGKGDEVADALYDPIIAGIELAERQEELREIEKKLRDQRITETERAELERRRAEVGKQLLIQTNEWLQYGTRVERINKISAFLSSDFWTQAYEGATVEQRIILDDWRAQLEAQLSEMVNAAEEKGGQVRDRYTGEIAAGAGKARRAAGKLTNAVDPVLLAAQRKARRYGENTGQAYADGIASKASAISRAAHKAAGAAAIILYASSPPGPASPLHEIDIWGRRTGQEWIDRLVDGIVGGRGALRGAVGGVGADLLSLSVGTSRALSGGLTPLSGSVAVDRAGAIGEAKTVVNNYAQLTGYLPVRSPMELTDQMDRLARTGEWMAPPKWREP